MAWLQIHQTLKDHRKVFDAADELDIPPVHMMGLLVSFWLWALDNAPSGELKGITPRMIARAAQWDKEADRFTEVLIKAGFLDVTHDDNELIIHDWQEYAGRLIDQRKAEKERSRKRRQAEVTQTTAEKSREKGFPDVTHDSGGSTQQAEVMQITDNCKKLGVQTTAGQPPVDRRQSRVEKSRVYINTPPTPSEEGDERTQNEHEREPTLLEKRFTEFWDAYPRKVAKQRALLAWKKIKPDAELHERIMLAVCAQKKSAQWQREHGQYIPHPATWLNGGQWDDETEVIDHAADRQDTARDNAGTAGEKDWTGGFKQAGEDITPFG